MSIFKDTLKPEVRAQLRARQEVISQDTRDGNANPNGAFIGYQTKNSWVKMTSFVNYDSGKDIQVDEANVIRLNSDGLYTNDELSRKYVLFGGVPYYNPNNDEFSLRAGVDKINGLYGSNLDWPSYRNTGKLDRPFGAKPTPGISSVQINSKSAYGSLREATVKFYAWDRHQLEELEILFMRPGYSVLLEWGWSKYIDYTDSIYESIKDVPKPTSVNAKAFTISNFTEPFINVYDRNLTVEGLYGVIDNKVKKTKCNYDAMLGYVKNFNWTLLDNGGFECTTTLISLGEVISSLKISANTSQIGDETNIFTDPNQERSYQYTDYEKILLTLKASSDSADFNISGSYANVDLADINISKVSTELGNKMSKRGHRALWEKYLDVSTSYAKQPYLKKTVSTNTNDGSTINEYNEYISFDVWVALMDSYFLLIANENSNDKYLYFEIPNDTTYCLAAPDSISVDPSVCYVDNAYAFPEINYIYDNPYTINGNKGVKSKLTYRNTASNNSLINFYNKDKKLGILKNIYINIDYLLNSFKNMNSSTNDDGVNILDYVQNVLNGISTALGGLNNFKVFAKENKIIIGDAYYVEDPSEAKMNKKFQFDLLGLKSICRDVNITSRIFQEQSTMIGIAAQAKANIGDIYSSSQTIFNAGLTDRLVINKNLPGAEGSISSPTANSIEDGTDALYNKLFLLVAYIKQYIIGEPYIEWSGGASGADQYRISNAPNPAASSATLRSILLQFNPEINFKALIPFELEITLDGIGGLVIGQIFTVNKNILPRDYYNKNLGFIITGISHDLSKNDWVTKIKTQICLLDDDVSTRENRIKTLSDGLNKARVKKVADLVKKYTKKSLNFAILKDYMYYLANRSLASYMFADLTNSDADGSNVFADLNFDSVNGRLESSYRYQSFEKFNQATKNNQTLEYWDNPSNNNVGDFINKYSFAAGQSFYPAKQSSFVSATGLTVTTKDNTGYTEFARKWIDEAIKNTPQDIKNLTLSLTDNTTYGQLLDLYKQEIDSYGATSYSDASNLTAFDPGLYVPIRQAIADTTLNTPLTPNSPIWDNTISQNSSTVTVTPLGQNQTPQSISVNYIQLSTDILYRNIIDYLKAITSTSPGLIILYNIFDGSLNSGIRSSIDNLKRFNDFPVYEGNNLKISVGTNVQGNIAQINVNSNFIKYYQLTGDVVTNGVASRKPYTAHRN